MNNLEEFKALGLSEQMLEAIAAKGFETPSPIQSLTIPVLLNQKNDIIAQAQTGTGKTAAFGIPLIEQLKPSKTGVQALVLVPTRELAIQVSEEMISFNQHKKLHISAIYGGASMSEQLRRLKKGIDIVVGTPGRVLDHIRRQTLVLDKTSFLILDEADEMLNMGFIDDIEEIMKNMNPDKRVMLFSATMPERIVSLSHNYMHETEILKVESKQITTDLTNQIYFEVRESDKFDALTRIIDVESDFYGIVFSRTKVGVDETTNRLLERGYAAEGLHGDVSQAQREKTLRKFKKKQVNILVATDVAARGIDINNLTHVINYSLPQDSESYVHRIGRTGRAGNQGTAITFISNAELRQFGFMKKAIKADIKKEALPTPHDIVEMKRGKIKEDLQQIVETGNYEDCEAMAAEILQDYEPDVALSALLRLAFKNELSESSYSEIRGFSVDRRGKARIFISIGRLDGYDARKMVSLLKRECGLTDNKIDDVKVMDSYSFATVPFADADVTVKRLNAIRKGGRPIAEVAKDRDSADAGQRNGSRKKDHGYGEKKGYDKRNSKNRNEEHDSNKKFSGKHDNEFGTYGSPDFINIEQSPEAEKRPVYQRDENGDWFSVFETRFGGSGDDSDSRKKKKASSSGINDKKGNRKKPGPAKTSRREKKEQKKRR